MAKHNKRRNVIQGNPAGPRLSVTATAAALNITEKRVRELIRNGTLKPSGKGAVDQASVVALAAHAV